MSAEDMTRGEAVKVRHPVSAPPTLRQSLLSTFDACQYSAYLSVKYGGIKPTHPIYRGRAFHETAHKCILTMQEHGHGAMAPDDAKAVMLEVLHEHPEWVIPAYALDELRVIVHRWATHFRLPENAVSEHPWALEVEGQTVTGTIDLCWRDGDTVHIRDWKAGWGVYTQGEVSGKDQETLAPRGARAAQLITYALLIADGGPAPFNLRGVNRFDCRFVFPMMGGVDGMLERPVVITRPELIEHREWLRLNVVNLTNRFGAARFTATQGSHCTRCPEPGDCPLKEGTKTLGPFERPATEAAEDWVFLHEDAKELWAQMKVYVAQLGPVPVGKDQELGMSATASGPRLALRKREVA